MAKRQQRILRVNQVLATKENSVARLAEKARHLEMIERQVRRALGSPLADHIALGECTPHRLVLVTDSPVWSSRIRYQSRRIVQSISDYFSSHSLPKIEIKVAPVEGREPRRNSKRATLSTSTAEQLDEAANAFSENKALQAVLRRLASRTHRPPE